MKDQHPQLTKHLGCYPKNPMRHYLVCSIGTMSALLLIGTLGFLVWALLKNVLTDDCVQFWSRILLFFWVLFPPLCFWAEYHLLWRPCNDPNDEHYREMFDRFKFSQETSSKIWLAIVTILAAFCWEGLKHARRDSNPTALTPAAPTLSAGLPNQ